MGSGGVGNDNIDGSQPAGGFLHESGDFILACDISPDGDGLASSFSDFSGNLLGPLDVVEGVDNHGCSSGGKVAHNGGSEALAAASDKRDMAGQGVVGHERTLGQGAGSGSLNLPSGETQVMAEMLQGTNSWSPKP